MKKLKSLLNKSSNIHSLTGNVLYALFSMLLFLYMVRTLDMELYGRWVIFLTAISLLDLLRVGLTGTGSVRLISTTKGLEHYRCIAASYHLNFLATAVLSMFFVILYFILKPFSSTGYYLPVLLFYPLLSFANLAHTQATNYNQGIVNFKRILVIRVSVGLLNLLFIGLYLHFFNVTFEGLVYSYVLSDIVVSLFVILKNWDGIRYWKNYDWQSMKNLLHFGKYSTATSIGSSLLKSSDTFIISMSAVMGAPAVAIYAIPMKFVELIEIPLRSFTSTAYPKLSNAFVESKEKFNSIFSDYLLFTVILMLPIVLITPFFSGFLLSFLGGSEYASSIGTQTNILYIIIVYILILPFDRFTGIALFAFNLPKENFYKVLSMLIFNIIFDLIAVFVFKSLEMVAIATVVFTIIGIFIGWRFVGLNTGYKISEFSKHFGNLYTSIKSLMGMKRK